MEWWKRDFTLFGGAQVAFRRQTRNSGHSNPWCPEGQGQTGPAVTFLGPENSRPTEERELKVIGEVLDEEMAFG